MVDETNVEPASGVEEAEVTSKQPTAKRPRSSRSRKAAEGSAQAAAATTAKRRKYSDQEKADMLKQIEAKLSQGDSTLKAAVRSTGITEQTYYQWKRAAKASGQGEPEQAARNNGEPEPTGDELTDLVQLEEENRRLRKLLAKKLRQENSELRKRLGLD